MKSVMEMHQIKYFLAVCTERNFSRAARLCRVSQPSLTRAIKLLEAEFGGSLFRRSRGHSHLTALGEIVRPHLEKVWEKSETAVASAREFAAASHPLEASTPAASSKPIRDCER
jgi:DNA-binding transcriptional LysR family regulator